MASSGDCLETRWQHQADFIVGTDHTISRKRCKTCGTPCRACCVPCGNCCTDNCLQFRCCNQNCNQIYGCYCDVCASCSSEFNKAGASSSGKRFFSFFSIKKKRVCSTVKKRLFGSIRDGSGRPRKLFDNYKF